MNESRFLVRQVEPAQPLRFDPGKCIGCNRCVNACPIDLLLPAQGKNQPPVPAYPDECWYCGCCVMECPADAIQLRHPLMNQVRWVEKNKLKEGHKWNCSNG